MRALLASFVMHGSGTSGNRTLGAAARLAAACLVLVALAGCGEPPRPNILLVTFDTTRWDRMGYAGGPAGVTPMLDAMASRGTWFETALTVQPLTLPSHTSILTGLYPTRHGVRNNGTFVVGQDQVTLAERLAAEGYETHAVISAFVLDSQFGLDQGFDTYDDDLAAGPKKRMFMFKEVPAKETTIRAVRWLERQRDASRPFFLWIHYFDPHANYEPPADVAQRFPGDPYAGEIHYADRELGRVFKSLDDSGELDETLFVFTSDHGDSMGEHGERTHGLFIYDATTRVPLIFSGPGVPERTRVDDVVRTVDIVPTLLDLLQLDDDAELDGRSLAPLWRGEDEEPRVAYMETLNPRFSFGWSELRALRDESRRVVAAPRREAYDVTRDPREQRNLLADGEPSPPVRQMLRELRSIEEADPWVRGEQSEGDLDEQARERLEALGYVWGGGAVAESDGPRPDPKDRLQYWESFQRAQNLIRDGELDAAYEAMSNLVAADPDNVVARSSLATVLMRTGRSDEALRLYREIIELDLRREKAYFAAARLLTEEGEVEEARALLESVLAMRPRNPAAHTLLAGLELRTGEAEAAEELLRRALELDPAHADTVTSLSDLLSRQDRIEEASQVLEAGWTANPSSPSIAYNLAVIVEQLGDAVRAVDLYKTAIRLDPDTSLPWNNLGSLLTQDGQLDEALPLIERAVDLDDGNVEAAYNLGVLYSRFERFAEAAEAYDRALTLRPGFSAAQSGLARAYERTGRAGDARAIWSELATQNASLYLELARFELEQQRESAAREALSRAERELGAQFQPLLQRFPALREMRGP